MYIYTTQVIPLDEFAGRWDKCSSFLHTTDIFLATTKLMQGIHTKKLVFVCYNLCFGGEKNSERNRKTKLSFRPGYSGVFISGSLHPPLRHRLQCMQYIRATVENTDAENRGEILTSSKADAENKEQILRREKLRNYKHALQRYCN
jgi:hypothetical protein